MISPNDILWKEAIHDEKDFGPDYYVFNIVENPQNLKEALISPDAIFWKEAVNDDMKSLISNRT